MKQIKKLLIWTFAIVMIITIPLSIFLISSISTPKHHSKLKRSSNPENIEKKISTEKQEIDFKKLDSKYCITYGNPKAPVRICEFFSFRCPHCVKLFKEDFEDIKTKLIDSGDVFFVFHPIPQDLCTIQAMICLEQLGEKEKQLFLEVLIEEVMPADQELMAKFMITAMKVFKKPLPQLDDRNFLEGHPAFNEVFHFLKQEKILAVPTVEINGQLFPKEVPSYQFIKSFT